MKAKYSHLNLRAEREAFINHHTARGNLMADWTAAFWTWLNNTRKFGSNGGRQLQGADKSVIEWEQYKEPEQTQGAIE